jgi:hypothetical protein
MVRPARPWPPGIVDVVSMATMAMTMTTMVMMAISSSSHFRFTSNASDVEFASPSNPDFGSRISK